MTYAIEKNIPTPELRFPRKKTAKYPFAKMKVGDSFFVPEGKLNRISTSMAYFHNHNKPKRVTARTIEGGVRIWRIK